MKYFPPLLPSCVIMGKSACLSLCFHLYNEDMRIQKDRVFVEHGMLRLDAEFFPLDFY